MSWDKLNEKGYLVIKNWIDPKIAVELGSGFNEFVMTHGVRDEQVPDALSFYNYLPFVEILCGMTGELNKLMGRAYLPCYVYARRYAQLADLKIHTDRPACETSMTVNFGGDRSWGIWIKDKRGNEVEVIQEPGDALLYQGCTQEHWRNCFQGFSYTQAFFHYVESRGPNRNQFLSERGKENCDLILPGEPVQQVNDTECKPTYNSHGISVKVKK